MVCKFCGKQLSDQAKFCNRCGASLTATENTPTKKRNTNPGWIVLIVLSAVTMFLLVCGIVLVVVLRIFVPQAPGILPLDPPETLATAPVWDIPTEPAASAYPYEEYSSPILFESDRQYLTAADLEILSEAELLLARSEIYGRHGVMFADPVLSSYFEHQDWYQPSIAEEDFDQAVFNEYEQANVQLIEVYEKIVTGAYAPAADNPYMPYYDPATELLLPKSSNTKLTTADLAGFNADQLIIIRNQIIALHGYTFGDRELMEYFLQCSWYRPSTPPGRTDLVEGMTSLEYENMEFINQYEQNPSPSTDLSKLDNSLSFLVETKYYSLYVPAYWKDYCVIIPSENTESGVNEVTFYEAKTYNATGGAGLLFSLELFPMEKECIYPDYRALGSITDTQGNGWNVIVYYPSDVQFNIENMALYTMMCEQIDAVLGTLQCKDGYSFSSETLS